MIFNYIKYSLILLNLTFFNSCDNNCKNSIKKEYYRNGEVKTILTNNCDGEVVKYEHYNYGGELGFEIYYFKNKPDKFYKGSPIINTIYNKEIYSKGDTVKFEIELVEPPFIDLNFYCEDKSKINELDKVDGLYKYEKVLKDSIDTIQFKVQLLFDNKIFSTYKRDITLIAN